MIFARIGPGYFASGCRYNLYTIMPTKYAANPTGSKTSKLNGELFKPEARDMMKEMRKRQLDSLPSDSGQLPL